MHLPFPFISLNILTLFLMLSSNQRDNLTHIEDIHQVFKCIRAVHLSDTVLSPENKVWGKKKKGMLTATALMESLLFKKRHTINK